MRGQRIAATAIGALLLPAMAWADEYRVRVTQPTEFGELTSEVKAVVPALRGGYEHLPTDEVVFIRERGDFTESEKTLINQAVAAHDPDIKAKRKAKQDADRASGDAKLKALGLTDAEIEARRP